MTSMSNFYYSTVAILAIFYLLWVSSCAFIMGIYVEGKMDHAYSLVSCEISGIHEGSGTGLPKTRKDKLTSDLL